MSMWGNLMSKAKDLADNLDKQITDSVGIDENGNETTGLGGGGLGLGKASSFAGILSGGSGHEPSGGGADASAWDDDGDFDDGFDDDDEEEEVAAKKGPAVAASSALPAANGSAAPDPTPLAPVTSPEEVKEKKMEDSLTDQDDLVEETEPDEPTIKMPAPAISLPFAAPKMLRSIAAAVTDVSNDQQEETNDVPSEKEDVLNKESPDDKSPPETAEDGPEEGGWDGDVDVVDVELDDMEMVEAPKDEVAELVEPEPVPPVAEPVGSAEQKPVADPEPVAEPEPAVEPEQSNGAVVDLTPAPTAEPSPAVETKTSEENAPPKDVSPSNDEAVETESKTLAADPKSVHAADTVAVDQSELKSLHDHLALREQQLANKSEQLAQLQALWEQQEAELRQKIQDTKEEAKKRIQRAKERCETAEKKMQHQAAVTSESGAQQAEIIAALREEGEKLARKQADMERSVRTAKGDARDLAQRLEAETMAKTQALEKISVLEADLAETKQSLTYARKGESQAGQLEQNLQSAREDAEKKATTIMSLEQQIKELKTERKELQAAIAESQKTAAVEADRESKKLRREHNDVIADLEAKIRTAEREAGVREDALRHEVTELRKRWQDAVRRADALSMDVQSSTAPLLRQLESMERQNRVRASGWAELETKLRTELEETVIENEKLSKERTDYKTKFSRVERQAKEQEAELKECKITIEDQTAKLTKLEDQLATLEADAEKREEEYARVERMASEGVSRVRSEMTQTVVDSEERYRGQIRGLENELRTEREKLGQLEAQMSKLLDNPAVAVSTTAPSAQMIRHESKPKKLRQAEGQADILAGALVGLGDSDDEDNETSSSAAPVSLNTSLHDSDDEIDGQNGMNSFAALEQLTSRLKAAQAELKTLRANLNQSEKARSDLAKELSESGQAREKLPLFEAKVRELTEDNREKEMEIQALRDDIAEVRDLYRTQLNQLLEEKAAGGNLVPPSSNGLSNEPVEAE